MSEWRDKIRMEIKEAIEELKQKIEEKIEEIKQKIEDILDRPEPPEPKPTNY